MVKVVTALVLLAIAAPAFSQSEVNRALQTKGVAVVCVVADDWAISDGDLPVIALLLEKRMNEKLMTIRGRIWVSAPAIFDGVAMCVTVTLVPPEQAEGE